MIRAVILVSILVGLIVGGLYVGPFIQENKGYVLISWQHYTVEMTALSMVLLFITSFLMVWLTVRLLTWLSSIMSGSWQWLSYFGSNRRKKAWQAGMLALEMQDYDAAKQQLIKAQGGDFNGLELLALAKTEYALQDYDNALRHWEQASNIKSVRVAAVCKRAEHYLNCGAVQEVLPLLDSLPDSEQQTPALIQLHAQALMQLGHWQLLQEKLAGWKKSLSKQQWQALQQQSAQGIYTEIANKNGAFELKQVWEKQPRKIRKDPIHQAAYINQLLEQNVYQEAEQALVAFQKKQPEPILLPLFKALRLPNPTASLKLVESWLKHDPQSPELLSILGHLASQGKDFNLAEQTLQKALAVRSNKDDLLLLAQVKEHQSDNNGALQLYKQCTVL